MEKWSVWRWLRVVVAFLIALIILLVLARWTRALEKRREHNVEQEVLSRVLQREGELGLLDLAGVRVNNIFYGEESITLFEGSLSDYRYSADELQNINVYEMANKSVVHITTISQSDPTKVLEALPQQGTGSGIVISSDGYILTNAHVVAESSQLTIRLYDGSSHAGKLIGVDLENDLAVIKIDLSGQKELTPIKFGTAANLKVGQKVMAIGNPFGYDRTMTIGMVSGLGRPVRTATNTVINGMIQTDAAINPGNSGGPLLNARGEMVGICTTIHSTSGVGQGIGFAIPVDTAISVIPDLIRYGKVVRGWFDITMVQLDASIVEYAELSVQEGILVSQVRSGGKAEKGGLRGGTKKVQYGSTLLYLGGDIIVEVKGEKIADLGDLYTALKDTHPQDVVEVTVIRKGERQQLKIELVQRPETVEWMVK